jgi:hypothetical protein
MTRGILAGFTPRNVLALLFVALQALLVARARFVEDSFFSWAPHDRHVLYRIEYRVGGVGPPGDGAARRYGLPAEGWNSHAEGDLFWVIRTREERLPAAARAEVTVTYRVNGRDWQTWRYP